MAKRVRRTNDELVTVLGKVQNLITNGMSPTKACKTAGVAYQVYKRHIGFVRDIKIPSDVQSLLNQLRQAIRAEVIQELKQGLK